MPSARPDAAGMTSSSIMSTAAPVPASGLRLSCMPFDRTVRGGGRHRRRRGRSTARRTAPPCPPCSARRAGGQPPRRVRRRHRRRGDASRRSQRQHHGEDRVAGGRSPTSRPKARGQRERDDEHQEDLEQVRPDRRVLERVRGVGVEEAAAVRAELLDRLLRRDEAVGDVLGAADERGDVGAGAPSDWTTPPATSTSREHERDRGRSRRPSPRTTSTQTLPSVPHLRRANPRTRATATARPTAAGQEVLHREAGHLHACTRRSTRPRSSASSCW